MVASACSWKALASASLFGSARSNCSKRYQLQAKMWAFAIGALSSWAAVGRPTAKAGFRDELAKGESGFGKCIASWWNVPLRCAGFSQASGNVFDSVCVSNSIRNVLTVYRRQTAVESIPRPNCTFSGVHFHLIAVRSGQCRNWPGLQDVERSSRNRAFDIRLIAELAGERPRRSADIHRLLVRQGRERAQRLGNGYLAGALTRFVGGDDHQMLVANFVVGNKTIDIDHNLIGNDQPRDNRLAQTPGGRDHQHVT